jgi:E3 Ubiquitin ligase
MHGPDRVKFWFLVAGLAGAAVYSFYYCFVSWRRNRVVGDTPTSRVRSAAQGYVEFTGRGVTPPNTENKAPLTGIPCTWWRYKIEERSGSGRSRSWSTVQSGTSVTPFILDDGTGQCLIDPRGADVFPSANEVWYGSSGWPDGVRIPSGGGALGWLLGAVATGKYRYTEHRLEPHERLYAIGSFRSLGGVSVDSPDRAVAELLRDWKQDQASLLARFDADHDGVISAAEWDRARAAAREQVVAAAGARAEAPGINVLSKPADGRAFMLAASDEQTLASRLRRRAAAGVLAFVASCSALTWMLTRL